MTPNGRDDPRGAAKKPTKSEGAQTPARGPVPYRPRYVPPTKSHSQTRPSYYPLGRSIGSYHRGRRRRPTPFLVMMTVFIIILIIVIVTSNSFKNCVSGVPSVTDTSRPETTASTPSTDADIGGVTTGPGQDEPITYDSFIIYIDPGHGFGDTGAVSDYLGDILEKDITLMVAKEVVEILQRRGYDARLTHDGETIPKASNDNGNDLFSALDERPTYINETGGDLLVSIHCDAYDTSDVSGTRIHYCGDNDYSEDSAELTNMLIRAISESFLGTRTARAYPHYGDENYAITRKVNAPAALIEMGFVSSPDDAADLLDPEWRSKIAEGIANGIAAFVGTYNAE